MAGSRRWVAIVLGVLALGFAAWGLLGPTSFAGRGVGGGRVRCGSFLAPRHIDSPIPEAVLGHDAGCEAPRRRHAGTWVLVALATGTVGVMVAIGGDPPRANHAGLAA